MGLKPFLCLLASIVLLTSRVSSKEEEIFLIEELYATPPVSAPPVVSPVKPPTPLAPRPPTLAPPVLVKPPSPPTPAFAPPVSVKPPSPPAPALAPPVLVKPPSSPTPAFAPPPQVPVKPPTPAPVPPKTRLDCIPLCVERCKLHSRKRLCARVCMTCCQRCKCVPPGTYGNREKCGKCYTDMTTRGGRRKCP